MVGEHPDGGTRNSDVVSSKPIRVFLSLRIDSYDSDDPEITQKCHKLKWGRSVAITTNKRKKHHGS